MALFVALAPDAKVLLAGDAECSTAVMAPGETVRNGGRQDDVAAKFMAGKTLAMSKTVRLGGPPEGATCTGEADGGAVWGVGSCCDSGDVMGDPIVEMSAMSYRCGTLVLKLERRRTFGGVKPATKDGGNGPNG
jgi:hypothetical protein